MQQPPGLAQVSRHEVLHGPQLGLAVQAAAVLSVQAVAAGPRQPQLQVREEPRAGRRGRAVRRVDVDILQVVFIRFNTDAKNVLCILS